MWGALPEIAQANTRSVEVGGGIRRTLVRKPPPRDISPNRRAERLGDARKRGERVKSADTHERARESTREGN